MSKTVIKVENLSKQYRLGQVGTGTLSHDLNRWWARMRGKDDPFKKVTVTNDRTLADGSEYVWALKNINFEVKEGEILGIIGKNGAGKSTLLKILSKVTGPTTGTIKTRGRIASLLEVGTGFHPEMTGRENIFMNGTLNGMNRHEIRAKLDEIIDFAGVAKYLDTPTKRYSSGMTVRLGFAVAAFLEPEILVVDEVLAVGDAEFQKKAIGKMQDVSRGQGRTVLFVSHNLGSIKTLCKKAIILENGALSYVGKVSPAIEKYMNLDGDYSEYPSIIEGESLNKHIEGIVDKSSSFLKIIRISLLDENLLPRSRFLSHEAVNIKFDFKIIQLTSDVRIVVSIVDEQNISVLNTLLSDSQISTTLTPGTYSSTCTFPPNFFGTKLYVVTVHFISPKKEHLVLNGIIKFHVQYQNDRYTYAAMEKTYFRPTLNWNINLDDESQK